MPLINEIVEKFEIIKRWSDLQIFTQLKKQNFTRKSVPCKNERLNLCVALFCKEAFLRKGTESETRFKDQKLQTFQ